MTGYAENVPEINDETSVEEIVEYVERCLENPIEIDGTTIWDFNSHEPDMKALEEAVEDKLKLDKYIIPFQVTGAWTFIVTLLPQTVLEAEILIYREGITEYYAYRNLNREIPIESKDRLRQDLAEVVRKR